MRIFVNVRRVPKCYYILLKNLTIQMDTAINNAAIQTGLRIYTNLHNTIDIAGLIRRRPFTAVSRCFVP